MRIYVTDDDNDNNNDDVDVDVDGNVDNNSQVNLHSPLTVHVSKLRMKLNEMKHEGEEEIVAKALDGQRYLLPLCEYM